MVENDLGIRYPIAPQRPDSNELFLRELRAARSNFPYLREPVESSTVRPDEIIAERVGVNGTSRILSRKDNAGNLIKTFTPHNLGAPQE